MSARNAAVSAISGSDLRAVLRAEQLLPVVADASAPAEVVAALEAAGMSCVEMTLRTPDSLDCLRAIADSGDFVIGAGTVLLPVDAQRSVEAGATFLATPGPRVDVMAWAADAGVPVLPGGVTLTEVMRASQAGVDLMKFFPVGPSGGTSLIQAFEGPFPQVSFVPRGGVSRSNAEDCLALPNVTAVGGTSFRQPGQPQAQSKVREAE